MSDGAVAESRRHGSHQNAVDRVSVRRRRRDGREDARARLVCNGFRPIGAVAAIAPSLRSRHAGLRISNARLLGTRLHDAVQRPISTTDRNEAPGSVRLHQYARCFPRPGISSGHGSTELWQTARRPAISPARCSRSTVTTTSKSAISPFRTARFGTTTAAWAAYSPRSWR